MGFVHKGENVMHELFHDEEKASLRGVVAERSGIKLTEKDASIILGLVKRGDRKHDISAFFGINTGRIYDIIDRKMFPDATPAPDHLLPPPGPYLSGRSSMEALKVLKSVEKTLQIQLELVRTTIDSISR